MALHTASPMHLRQDLAFAPLFAITWLYSGTMFFLQHIELPAFVLRIIISVGEPAF
jgi:hypothetical protein